MKKRSILTAASSVALLLAAALPLPAQAATAASSGRIGTTSLAEVLTSDGNRFDSRTGDYDVLTEAVLAVLKAKPGSDVGVLADGTVALTAFIPNDASMRRLNFELTGNWIRSERGVFKSLVAAAGVDTIEQVLLYHVVPGATITAKQALSSDGTVLTTAQGGEVTVDVLFKQLPLVQLGDQDTNDTDPFLDPRRLDINAGNKQIAHGILLVLRPVDLP